RARRRRNPRRRPALGARPGAAAAGAEGRRQVTISRSVITGYNTDVKHKSRVFHVQTEDKGDGNPCVESLVYVGGEILATRRVSYEELTRKGRDDQAIQELMEQQHRTMIAAIQRGKFDGPNGGVRASEDRAAAPEPAGEATATAGPSPLAAAAATPSAGAT